MKKMVLAVLLALCLTPAVSMAEVIVRIAPPVAVVETPGPAPHPGWVWVSGYHRWDGHRYVWVHGHWAKQPHPGAVWVAHHWERRGDGWVLVQGYWR